MAKEYFKSDFIKMPLKGRFPVILCFVDVYLPGFRSGGPVRTIANFVDHFGDEFDIRIVTRDRDIQDREAYAEVKVNAWNVVGNAQVFYASPQTLTLAGITRLLNGVSYDVLYLNSFFSVAFTIFPLVARRLCLVPNVPCVIAPRGEFSSAALALKAYKKRLYLAVASWFGLYRGLCWQASSVHEQRDILRELAYVHDTDIHEAIDLPPRNLSMVPSANARSAGEPLRVCFLSRISPKKNLDFALRVLALVRAEIQFTIYGPVELEAYWQVCKQLIALLPSNVQVNYGGEVHPGEVIPRLAEHDLFFFPTRGENYGHVIHEALSAGLPVLISDQTPWQDFEPNGIGWALSLDSESVFARQIDIVGSWTEEKAARVRYSSWSYAQKHAVDPSVLEANRSLFLGVLS